VLHQVGVSFDLYYDARKHKIKKKQVFLTSAKEAQKEAQKATCEGVKERTEL